MGTRAKQGHAHAGQDKSSLRAVVPISPAHHSQAFLLNRGLPIVPDLPIISELPILPDLPVLRDLSIISELPIIPAIHVILDLPTIGGLAD